MQHGPIVGHNLAKRKPHDRMYDKGEAEAERDLGARSPAAPHRLAGVGYKRI